MEVSFEKLYDKLKKTEFDNTLQAKIQALFVSHIPSMPYNYWTEASMADDSADLKTMLDRIVEKDWNENDIGSIGAKHYFESKDLVAGFKCTVLQEEELTMLNEVQKGTKAVDDLLDKFHNVEFQSKHMKAKAALDILKADCMLIEECVKSKNLTDGDLKAIRMPAARAVAYRLIKGKDPTPEMQHSWYRHSLQKYVKPPQDSKKLERELFTRIRQMSKIDDVVAAAVKFAQSKGVLSGEPKERACIYDALTKWAEKQATPDTAGPVREEVLTKFERALSTAQAKAQRTNPSSSFEFTPHFDASAKERTTAQAFTAAERPIDPAKYALAEHDLSSSVLSDRSDRSGVVTVTDYREHGLPEVRPFIEELPVYTEKEIMDMTVEALEMRRGKGTDNPAERVPQLAVLETIFGAALDNSNGRWPPIEEVMPKVGFAHNHWRKLHNLDKDESWSVAQQAVKNAGLFKGRRIVKPK